MAKPLTLRALSAELSRETPADPVSVKTLRRWIKVERLPHVRDGRRYLVYRDVFDAWMKAKQVGAA